MKIDGHEVVSFEKVGRTSEGCAIYRAEFEDGYSCTFCSTQAEEGGGGGGMFHHKMRISLSNGITIYDNHYSSSDKAHTVQEWADFCGLQNASNAMYPCVYVDSNAGKVENTVLVRFQFGGGDKPTILMYMNGDVNPVDATIDNYEDTVTAL